MKTQLIQGNLLNFVQWIKYGLDIVFCVILLAIPAYTTAETLLQTIPVRLESPILEIG